MLHGTHPLNNPIFVKPSSKKKKEKRKWERTKQTATDQIQQYLLNTVSLAHLMSKTLLVHNRQR